ncbi:NAD-dependent epimerase/dehydratase family protein [Lentilactobacillus buchneri]|uniref:Nucleoside-diphosphate-sugar epimerase n=1 Tax=Lentilactobacillus buchneri subsp. silagei CD034 TaxID=1071400 RepID=J9WA50_LENBU|nr:NAD-dependent epimerase/dehydratase family protein [Lentilactobacillus buchneri]MCC6101641.1 NAD-dependent epimerase/dehydratase family protein [Lactobacillus sp.]AFS00956.1 nucleoside-diphosphate-sugar epimerase [Lentilactobacillus buchneri subsp. silagei CD034]MCT2899908.1 NAD-dependent epimerase/dehydratase family protein [Lentilactobacillus buchneri]MCT3542879.1 NAD-dependent epimerase/dehydratase family protein [Lentilactobacillus buchneri]MCT3544422.1 NAD-dependent epimerase/dehydrata
MTKKILVTGGNGFLGLRIISQLLTKGYDVRTTLRSLDKQSLVLDTLAANNIANVNQLDFVQADLSRDEGWQEAMNGITDVMSVASPVFFGNTKDKNAAMRPAIDGITRIIGAAQNAGVERLVMTANFGGVGFSNLDKNSITDENDWTNPDQKGLSLYEKSKLLAEKEAWKLVNESDNSMALTTINPVAILGPAMNGHISGSFGILENLMNGSMKRIPNIPLNIVDVRDVADLHIRAMENPNAAGERFIATADGQITMPEMAAIIRQHYPQLENKVADKILPNWMVRVGSLFNQQAKEGQLLLDMNRNVSNQKARKLLGWQPIGSIEETILATLQSMDKFGLLK